MRNPRELSVRGVVTDTTYVTLIVAGWKCSNPRDPYNSMWFDPRSPETFYAINQAAAIQRHRSTPPKYRFTNR